MKRTRQVTRRRFLGALAAGAGLAAVPRFARPGAGRSLARPAADDTRRVHLRWKALHREDLYEDHDWAG